MSRVTLTRTVRTALLGPPYEAVTPAHERALSAKARRVVLLILAIGLMGFSDLVITLTYMRSVGMIEVNPIARYMIEIGSVGQLIRYKLFTMGLSCGVLYILRRHPRAEHGAWLCVAILFVLTIHWVRYNSAIVDYSNEIHVLSQSQDDVPAWVHIPYTN